MGSQSLMVCDATWCVFSDLHLPSKLSRASWRPRFLPGFRTQWLLVAVMSKTSHPSSAAQITRESSRNRSESLMERKEMLVTSIRRQCPYHVFGLKDFLGSVQFYTTFKSTLDKKLHCLWKSQNIVLSETPSKQLPGTGMGMLTRC